MRNLEQNKTLNSSLLSKYPVKQQIHFNGNVFGNKYCRCNKGSLFMFYVFGVSTGIVHRLYFKQMTLTFLQQAFTHA